MDPYTLKQKVLKLIYELESGPLNEFQKNVARIEFFKQAYIGLQKAMEAAGDFESAPKRNTDQQIKKKQQHQQHNKQRQHQPQHQQLYQKQYKQQTQDEQQIEYIGPSTSKYSQAELMELSNCSNVDFEEDIFLAPEKEEKKDEVDDDINEEGDTQFQNESTESD